MRFQTGWRLKARGRSRSATLPSRLVEQLHVAAERYGRDHELDRVLAEHAPIQRLAEADGEAQHADAELARDPEMAELVHRDQHADRHDER